MSQAFFCAQQSPHRVQSSTNLDLVDCVGSDLLLAMNCLDVGDQGRAAHSCSSKHQNNDSLDRFPGDGGVINGNINNNNTGADVTLNGGTSSPPGHEFLPLAARAPPPTRRPAWLIAQQQARLQNEHFPSRIYSGERIHQTGSAPKCVGGGGGVGSDVESGAEDFRSEHSAFGGSSPMNGGRSRGDEIHRREYSRDGGSSHGSPASGVGAGFGGAGGGHGQGQQSGGTSEQGSSSRAPSPGTRRPSSGGRGTPHLDESWTAVLNAPAGAELIEFLTEQASRALVLWNVETIPEDVLRTACEVHGPLYYLRVEHRRKRVVFLAYYDIRDAVNAHQSLGRELFQLLFFEVSRESEGTVG